MQLEDTLPCGGEIQCRVSGRAVGCLGSGTGRRARPENSSTLEKPSTKRVVQCPANAVEFVLVRHEQGPQIAFLDIHHCETGHYPSTSQTQLIVSRAMKSW